MKRQDYQIKRGIEKLKFERSCEINDRDTNLTIELSLNHSKGIYTVQPKVSTGEVTGEPKKDKATCAVVGELLFESIQYANNWRLQWLENNPKQGELPMLFPDGDEGESEDEE